MDWLMSLTSPEVLTAAVGTALPLAFGLMALTGLVIGLAPSTVTLVPVVAGFVVGQERSTTGRAFALSGAFVLGIATVDAALGALFGFLGDAVIRLAARSVPFWNVLIAGVLVLMGLALLRKVRFRLPMLKRRLREPETVAGAYLLGIPFGLSTCPACTPMVLPAVGAAAATGSVGLGAALLFVFGLARGAPLVVAGVSTGALKRARGFSERVPAIERTVGWLLLGAAAFFLVQAAQLTGLLPT